MWPFVRQGAFLCMGFRLWHRGGSNSAVCCGRRTVHSASNPHAHSGTHSTSNSHAHTSTYEHHHNHTHYAYVITYSSSDHDATNNGTG